MNEATRDCLTGPRRTAYLKSDVTEHIAEGGGGCPSSDDEFKA